MITLGTIEQSSFGTGFIWMTTIFSTIAGFAFIIIIAALVLTDSTIFDRFDYLWTVIVSDKYFF